MGELHGLPIESVTVPFPRDLVDRNTTHPVTDQEFESLRASARRVIESELRMLMVVLIANSEMPSKYNDVRDDHDRDIPTNDGS